MVREEKSGGCSVKSEKGEGAFVYSKSAGIHVLSSFFQLALELQTH